MSAEERFWVKADLTGDEGRLVFDGEPCWLWTGGVSATGYSAFRDGERVTTGHRFAYELLVGSIPDGLKIDHLCRVLLCVNPAHLEPVTHRENILRGGGENARRHRLGICARGHRRTPDNVGTHRRCLQCRREDWHANKKEAA